jgi:hypothetical protein
MQIEAQGRDTSNSCLMIALEPPGNVARDLVSFKRALFAEHGLASGLALPEVAALAFGLRETEKRFIPRGAASRALDGAWEGIEGSFSSGDIEASSGLLYLALTGPMDALGSRAAAVLEKLGLAAFASAPLEAGRGFFICGSTPSGEPRPGLPTPPHLSFGDCSLVLLGLRFGADPFAAAIWTELGRAKRRTGASPFPSGRGRR